MEFLTVIEIIGGVLCGTGLVELIKFIITRKEVKKAAALENKEKEVDITNKEHDQAIEEWKAIAEERKARCTELEEQVREKDSIILEKDATISDYRSKLDDQNTKVAVLTLTRCQKLNCVDREPPFGFKEISVKDGALVEDN